MSYGIIYIDKKKGEDIMTLSEYQLRKYAEKFLSETYGMKLTVPLEMNGRLKKACGRFVYYKNHRTPKSVQMNKYFVENNEPTVVLDVLRHELVHYALFMLGKPYSDGHPTFENELKRLGVVSQQTIDKYTIQSKPTKIQFYECADCKHEFRRQRALANGGRYHRCTCGGRLIDKGKKVMAS
jgi:SprT-like protein